MTTSDLVAAPDTGFQADTRSRIVQAAAKLLTTSGRQGVTTRAVAAAAAVQAPAIYRLFNDMDGLLDAVAEYLLSVYVADKAALDRDPDPVADLRHGWDMQIAFSLGHPDIFALAMANPSRSQHTPAAIAGTKILRQKIERVAQAGRLKISQQIAEDMIRAAGNGLIFVLLTQPVHMRDPGLAIAVQDAILSAILTDEAPEQAYPTAAVTLRASLPQDRSLGANEKALMIEWLDRIINRSNT